MNHKTLFQQASSFADDIYTHQKRTLARYQAAFLLSLGLNVVAICAVMMLSKLQTLIPIMVHHYDNGVMTVEPVKQNKAPINRTQIESDLVRYVINRESYDINSFRGQYDLVNLLSNRDVARDYSSSQSARDKNAPIVQLGDKFLRRVHVVSVNFIDNLDANEKDLHKNHRNLAEVVFTLIDLDKATGNQTSKSYNALIAWQYVQPSESPEQRWQNFDGFQVMSYSKQVRNEINS